jgi:hypothetical protein
VARAAALHPTRNRAPPAAHTALYSVAALEELQAKCARDVVRALSGDKAVYPM